MIFEDNKSNSWVSMSPDDNIGGLLSRLNPTTTNRRRIPQFRRLETRTQRQAASNQKPAARSQHPVASIQKPAASSQKPEASSRRPDHAFTLLEVMVALAVMSIVLVSVYRMHSQSIAMNAAARFYTQAPLLAQHKMAELEAESADDLSGDSGDFGDDFPGYTWQVDVNEVSSEALGEVADDLVGIDVTVSYNENEYTYSIRTYRFLRQ